MSSFAESVAGSLFTSSATVTIILALFAIFVWYKVAYAPFTYFTSRGISGPPPSALIGNVLQIGNDPAKFFIEMTKKYGKVFGYYIGCSPVYVITDLDMAKSILVKQFNNFTDRLSPVMVEGLYSSLGAKPDLLMMPAKQWRPIRRIVSSTFTSKKLKMMAPLVEDSCDALLERFEKIAQSGRSDEMKNLYGQFTMETILSTAFGHKAEILRGKADDDLLFKAVSTFCESFGQGGGIVGVSIILAVLSYLPNFVIPVMAFIGRLVFPAKIFKIGENMESLTKELIQIRRKRTNSNANDFIQLLINASADDEEEEQTETTPSSCPVSTSSTTISKKFLSDDEVLAMSRLFLLAGYDTTSNTLAFTSYLLALNPDKQDKLCAEIDAYYEENEQASLYDAAHSIPYVEYVIQESLRIFPVGLKANRYCNKTCTVGDLTIPEGAMVDIPFSPDKHHNSWEASVEFMPERFQDKTKHHPLLHKPFGSGPRNCVGMRFALMESKMALVNILRKFKFERASDTQVPLKIGMMIVLTALNGIHLKAVHRA